MLFIFPLACTAECRLDEHLNNMRKWAISADDGEREVQSGLFDGEYDGEHNGVSLVEISKIFVLQSDFLSMGCIIWQISRDLAN